MGLLNTSHPYPSTFPLMEKGILRSVEDPQRGLPRRPLRRPLEDGIVDVAAADHHGDAPGSREASKQLPHGGWIRLDVMESAVETKKGLDLQPLRRPKCLGDSTWFTLPHTRSKNTVESLSYREIPIKSMVTSVTSMVSP